MPGLLIALLVAAGDLPSQARMEGALREALSGSCPGRAVSFDPDLAAAARAFVDAVASGRAQANGTALAFYASLESAEPSPVAGVATVSPPSQADRAVGDIFPKGCRFNRIGVAAATLGDGRALVGALAAQHDSDLAHIAGRVEPGATVSISGRLAAGLSNPRLFVTRPDGSVEELKLASSGGAFRAQVALKASGEHSIEVLAAGAGGPQVIAMRRVFAGAAPPPNPPPESGTAKGLDGVELSIGNLRAARGLASLKRDPELDAIAEGHSVQMARTRTFAHVLESDGSVTDRLRKAGYAYRSAGENIGLSQDALSAHDAVASSPAHLSNLLDPRHRRLGLGIAHGRSPDGTASVYLTEVLAAPVIGSRDPAGDVARIVATERKKRRLPALERDATLDGIARTEIAAVALRDLPGLPKEVTEHALESDPSLRSIVGELIVGSAPDDSATSRNLGDPRWTRLGVGAVYANSKAYGPGRLWVLILYGN